MDYKIMLDLAEDIGSVGMCDMFTLAFSEYQLQEINGQIYVVGINPIKTDLKKGFLAMFKEGNDSAILFDLFKTIQGPLPQDWSNNWLSEVIPASRVIEWCYKYGLLWDNEFKKALTEKRPPSFFGFPLYEARRRIAYLYSYFKLWESLIYKDYEKAEKLAPLAVTFPKGYETLEEFLTHLKNWLPTTLNVELMITLDFSSNNPHLKTLADNAYDVCMFQLLLLMTRAPIEVKKHLKVCKNPSCGSYFWADHGNQKYCSGCNAKTVWDQTKRKR